MAFVIREDEGRRGSGSRRRSQQDGIKYPPPNQRRASKASIGTASNTMGFLSNAKVWQRGRKDSKSTLSLATEPETPRGAGLMDLPPELRLSIFEYVFSGQKPITLYNGSDNIVLVGSSQGKDNSATELAYSSSLGLLRVNRQIHEEAEEAFYTASLFGIVASPYQAYQIIGRATRFKRFPNESVPLKVLQRVRRLLFVMYLKGWPSCDFGYRICDLRYLQAMTSLREIRITFTNAPSTDTSSLDEAQMRPIRGILESIPRSALMQFGRPQQANGSDAGSGGDLRYAFARDYADKVCERQGVLSGSEIDHTYCSFKACVEDKGCANSESEERPPKKEKKVSRMLSNLADKSGLGSPWRRMDL